MQIMKRADLPPEMQQELEGARFCILSAGRWPKVLAKGVDPIDLAVDHRGIERHHDSYCPKTGTAQRVAKTGTDLCEEIGSVDHPEAQMYRIDD